MNPNSHEFDFVIPLFQVRWNTRAVLEGLTTHYQPRAIHIVTPASQVQSLQQLCQEWATAPVHVHDEDLFFVKSSGLSKKEICSELDLGTSLYNPGWFYQQILKLGASEGIESLSEWYVVWDSDLLPVQTWPLIRQTQQTVEYTFALLQHKRWGNPKIVRAWDTWIQSVLGVQPITDRVGTFVPHHMWFRQSHLESFKQQINRYYGTQEHWSKLMMRSANELGTFSEYWAYVSWVAAKAPEDLSFYDYQDYGNTTERFFDDGTGLFSKSLRQHIQKSQDGFSPEYAAVEAFILSEYGREQLPSSLAFESSPRHLKKDEANMHIEEQRSRWNPRIAA
ncbi:MAG: DUF6492 family protein [Cyanobacteria bacterium P01_F01_bin.42]